MAHLGPTMTQPIPTRLTQVLLACGAGYAVADVVVNDVIAASLYDCWGAYAWEARGGSWWFARLRPRISSHRADDVVRAGADDGSCRGGSAARRQPPDWVRGAGEVQGSARWEATGRPALVDNDHSDYSGDVNALISRGRHDEPRVPVRVRAPSQPI